MLRKRRKVKTLRRRNQRSNRRRSGRGDSPTQTSSSPRLTLSPATIPVHHQKRRIALTITHWSVSERIRWHGRPMLISAPTVQHSTSSATVRYGGTVICRGLAIWETISPPNRRAVAPTSTISTDRVTMPTVSSRIIMVAVTIDISHRKHSTSDRRTTSNILLRMAVWLNNRVRDRNRGKTRRSMLHPLSWPNGCTRIAPLLCKAVVLVIQLTPATLPRSPSTVR